jgi:hypothetical protein
MRQEASSKVQQYISKCDQLLSQLRQVKPHNTPGNKLGNDLVSSLAGQMARELLGFQEAGRYGKNFAKDYLKSEQKKLVQQQRKVFEGQFAILLNDVQSFLQTVSIRKARLSASGNSHELVKRLDSIYRANKLETKMPRLRAVLSSISTLHLVYNTEITGLKQEWSQGQRRGANDTLKRLETGLRQLIEKELSATSPASWWKQRIPSDVRIKAEDRKLAQDKLWPWYDSNSTSLMFFLDFNDYAKIIDRSDNWRDAFLKVFVDKTLILAKLRELDPIRKEIAHNRELGKRERARLELLSEDVLVAIRRHSGLKLHEKRS